MKNKQTILISALYIDGLITTVFGIFSWFNPYSTFGSIVAFSPADGPTTLSAFTSLSVMYVLIGLSCFIAAKTPTVHRVWFSALMMGRHLWIGVVGFTNIGAEWIVGNPVPDIIIHGLFFSVYMLGILFYSRKTAVKVQSLGV